MVAHGRSTGKTKKNGGPSPVPRRVILQCFGGIRGRAPTGHRGYTRPIPIRSARLSAESYLELEDSAHVRHEYLAGEAFAMAGASPRHNRIAVRLVNAIAERIAGEPCDVYMSDVKLKVTIDQDQYFYYPDVMVACAREREQAQYVENPKLIVEVRCTRALTEVSRSAAFTRARR